MKYSQHVDNRKQFWCVNIGTSSASDSRYLAKRKMVCCLVGSVPNNDTGNLQSQLTSYPRLHNLYSLIRISIISGCIRTSQNDKVSICVITFGWALVMVTRCNAIFHFAFFGGAFVKPWPNGKCVTTEHHQTLFGDQTFWCLKPRPNGANMFYQTSSNIWTQRVVGHKITQSTTTISTLRQLR